MTFQLWQLLLKIKNLEPGNNPTCADCFAIMDLLLLGAELGLDLGRLQRLGPTTIWPTAPAAENSY